MIAILSEKKEAYIEIEKNGEIKEHWFYYEPIPEWTIYNNFFDYKIKTMITNSLNEIIIGYDSIEGLDKKFFVKNYGVKHEIKQDKEIMIDNTTLAQCDDVIYIKDNTINIIGCPDDIVKYSIYGEERYQQTIINIRIYHKDFGQVYTPGRIGTIRKYKQRTSDVGNNENTGIDEGKTDICIFYFYKQNNSNKPEDIFETIL